jgi:hypothetical protein
MKEYTFRIVWENSYPPATLNTTYHEKYSKLSPYEITVQSTACKTAMVEATNLIRNRTNNIANFTLVPSRG